MVAGHTCVWDVSSGKVVVQLRPPAIQLASSPFLNSQGGVRHPAKHALILAGSVSAALSTVQAVCWHPTDPHALAVLVHQHGGGGPTPTQVTR